jgi:hypothetical protein
MFSEPTADLPYYWVTRLLILLPQSLQDILMTTKMLSQITDHGSMAFIVIHAYRKFVAKKNKWMGCFIYSKSCNILQQTIEKALLTKN